MLGCACSPAAPTSTSHRRDTIALSGRRRGRRQRGRSRWSIRGRRYSGNTNIAFNGQKMQIGRRALPHRQGHADRSQIRTTSRSREYAAAGSGSGDAGSVDSRRPRRRRQRAADCNERPSAQCEFEVMRIGRSITSGVQARVVVLTADAAFRGMRSRHFRRQRANRPRRRQGHGCRISDQIDVDGATVVVADLDAGDEAELQALERLMTAHRQLAAGRRRHAKFREAMSRAA